MLQNVAFQTRPTTCAFTDNNIPRSRSPTTAVAAAASSISSNNSNADLLPDIREAVMEAGGEQAWTEATQILSDFFASSEEDAELCLADAYRWKAYVKASDMMKLRQNPVIPDATKVREALVWLQEGPLEMNDRQMRTCIREYPSIYLVEPKESYRKVMGSAPRNYRDAGILKELIEDDPNILQVTYNCDGEGCQSVCGSCWVARESRLPSSPIF